MCYHPNAFKEGPRGLQRGSLQHLSLQTCQIRSAASTLFRFPCDCGLHYRSTFPHSFKPWLKCETVKIPLTVTEVWSFTHPAACFGWCWLVIISGIERKSTSFVTDSRNWQHLTWLDGWGHIPDILVPGSITMSKEPYKSCLGWHVLP